MHYNDVAEIKIYYFKETKNEEKIICMKKWLGQRQESEGRSKWSLWNKVSVGLEQSAIFQHSESSEQGAVYWQLTEIH